MAVIHGESGAFKCVKGALAQVGLSINCCRDLPGILADMEKKLPLVADQAEQAYEKQLSELRTWHAAIQEYGIQELLRMEKRIGTQIIETYQRLSPPAIRANPLTFLGYLLQWPGLRIRLVKLHLQRRCEDAKIKQDLTQAATRLDSHVKNRNAILTAAQELSRRAVQVGSTVRSSPDYSGAIAEEAVCAQLTGLPDTWHVIADVCLKYHTYIRFENDNLISAQIDYVVVGPGGVFDIEVKAWSKDFVASQKYFDPYQQVARSSYLLHRILRDSNLPAKVRSVIVTSGALPEKPDTSYAKVLRPEALCGYIEWFSKELSPVDVERVVRCLTDA